MLVSKAGYFILAASWQQRQTSLYQSASKRFGDFSKRSAENEIVYLGVFFYSGIAWKVFCPLQLCLEMFGFPAWVNVAVLALLLSFLSFFVFPSHLNEEAFFYVFVSLSAAWPYGGASDLPIHQSLMQHVWCLSTCSLGTTLESLALVNGGEVVWSYWVGLSALFSDASVLILWIHGTEFAQWNCVHTVQYKFIYLFLLWCEKSTELNIFYYY